MITLKKIMLSISLALPFIPLEAKAKDNAPIPIPYAGPKPAITLKLPEYRQKLRLSAAPASTVEAASTLERSMSPLDLASSATLSRVPEINSIEEFPALLSKELLGFGEQKPDVWAYFDNDDTLVQREWHYKFAGKDLDFKYLSSPEIERQLDPFITKLIKEICGTNLEKELLLLGAVNVCRNEK